MPTMHQISEGAVFSTANYDVQLGTLRGTVEQPISAELAKVYYVRHRAHGVAATYVRTLAEAIAVARALEAATDEVVNKSVEELMQSPPRVGPFGAN